MSKQFQHISEANLLLRYAADGNKELLGAVLSRYTTLLFGVCMKYLKDEDLSKDMVQQVFLKVLSLPHQNMYDNFGGWLYTIAKNACLSALRKNIYFIPDEHLQYIAADEDKSVTEHYNDDYRIQQLKAALENLKDEQKICLSLFYLSNQSYQEIAQVTGIDLQKVKSHIQNGKRNLKLKLENINIS